MSSNGSSRPVRLSRDSPSTIYNPFNICLRSTAFLTSPTDQMPKNSSAVYYKDSQKKKKKKKKV